MDMIKFKHKMKYCKSFL